MTAVLSHLYCPDALMPAQYAAMHRREGIPDPERRLRIAVLEDAVDVLTKRAGRAPGERESAWRRHYVEARAWVAADDRGQPFSFVLICEALALDADAIRSRLLARCPAIPLVPPDAPLHAVPATRPPERTDATALRDRAWQWAQAQAGTWTAYDMALAVRCSLDRARGFACRWALAGRVAVVRRGVRGRTAVNVYRTVQVEVANG